MTGLVIRFEKVSLGYEGKVVLEGIDFSVPSGSFMGILGPNGSGKTTLIRALLGLSPSLSGRIVADGPLGGHPRFGYMPQKERLDSIYPLTAHAVVAMGTCRKWEPPGLRNPARKAMIERCLMECGVREFADKRFGDLSGGQRQRTLLARALAAEPEILVLDEPLAGIDAATQQSILELLSRLKAQGGITVILVSHRIQAEKDLFSHVIWVEKGAAKMGLAAEMLASARVSAAFRSGL